MCDRCDNRRNMVPVTPNTVTSTPTPTSIPNSMRIAAPIIAAETLPVRTVDVQGKLYINRRLKPFGLDSNLNSISLALYVFICFFIIVAVVLAFFSIRS